MEELFKTLEDASQFSVLNMIRSYNDEMTISQVVRFFERQNMTITKTMIQNYVRVNVLPPPIDKRYYTKEHLLFLYIIDTFKAVYSLEEIKQVFIPVTRDTETFDDDVLDMFSIFKIYLHFFENAVENYKTSYSELSANFQEIIKGKEDNDKNGLVCFLHQLNLMAQSTAHKQIVKLMLEKE